MSLCEPSHVEARWECVFVRRARHKTHNIQVKNSWGTGFGMDGYFLLARGKFPAGCGTASSLLTPPSYPVYRQ